MGRDCNLELCLLPAGVEASLPPPRPANSREESAEKLTIFYKGRVSVCNVTEFQAGEILRLAEQETNQRLKTPSPPPPPSKSSSDQPHPGSSEPQAPDAALSVKRSLQRFLQKRMSRIHATSPYSHHP